MSSIKNKFISGVIWEAVGRFSALGIQFVVTIVIARALLPSDFGVIGLLTVFIALGQILLDSGFSQALIRRKDTDQIYLSSVYFLNMSVGIVLYFILFAISPLIANFYEIPELTNYARVIFLIIPINSFGLVQNVIIQKELDFKKTATANVVSAILSGIIGVTMAYSGFGVWSLVAQQLSIHTIRTLLYILQRRWVPIFNISFNAIKEMFAFSVNLMLHSIVNVTMKNIYVLVIGKFFPVTQVGYYTQADKFQEISASTISEVVMKVSFPALVQKRDEPAFLREAYSKIFNTTVFLIAPLMFFLMCIGEPLFRLLLTEKWLPAVPYFRILCVYGMVIPTIQISYNLYKLFGKGRLLLMIDSFRHLLVVCSLFISINYGINFMLYGLVVCTVVMSLVNLKLSSSLISISLLKQLKDLLPYYIISCFISLLLLALPVGSSDFINILSQGFIFIVFYVFICYKMNLEGYKEFSQLLVSLYKKL